MTRFNALLSVYSYLDTITTGLILLAVWAASTGHLLDWLTEHRGKFLVKTYWFLIVFSYISGLVFIGSNY